MGVFAEGDLNKHNTGSGIKKGVGERSIAHPISRSLKLETDYAEQEQVAISHFTYLQRQLSYVQGHHGNNTITARKFPCGRRPL